MVTQIIIIITWYQLTTMCKYNIIVQLFIITSFPGTSTIDASLIQL